MKLPFLRIFAKTLLPSKREFWALAWIVIAVVLGSVTATAIPAKASDLSHATPANPANVLGNASCIKCHASEQAIWEATPHARTFDELHRRPEAAQIASRLGIESIKHSGRCVACHYTQQPTLDPNAVTNVSLGGFSSDISFHAIAGISCESCHGAARNWLETHHDYGGPGLTRETESPVHRAERIAQSVSLGMRNPRNVYLVAQSCYRCHTTGDEELVNVGGHSAGSLDFELVSWSQGTVRHNFVGTDGKQNLASTPHRLRFMFVAGLIADIEASLRAVATATEKSTYATTVAKRAARAGARLRSVSEKVNDARLAEAVAIIDSIKIKLNNAVQLEAAANKLAAIGYQFAEAESDPNETELHNSLEVLDSFIPDQKTWK